MLRSFKAEGLYHKSAPLDTLDKLRGGIRSLTGVAPSAVDTTRTRGALSVLFRIVKDKLSAAQPSSIPTPRSSTLCSSTRDRGHEGR